MNGLNHNALTCSAVPIPPWERPLQTVEAQPYFNVSQASLVLEGNLEVTDKDGKTHTLSDGDLYCVGPGETHSLHAIGDTHMISVFNPPLVGTERLDATGGYPIS